MKALGIPVEDNVKLANATNPNIETLRNSIIPTQLCQVKVNTGYGADFGVFEVGRVIKGLKDNGLCNEQKMLAITLFSKTKDMKELYLELRDIIAVIASDLKHKTLGYVKAEPKHAYEHPVNLNTILIDGEEIGTIAILHPVVSRNIDKKANIVFAEIDMSAFTEAEVAPIVYDEPSKFPSMTYDISVEIPAGVLFESLEKGWKDEGKGLLKSTRIVDTYDTDEFHSITVRFEFSSNERTLSSTEIQEIMDKVIENLNAIGVTLRG